jgi:hypothetical protein
MNNFFFKKNNFLKQFFEYYNIQIRLFYFE